MFPFLFVSLYKYFKFLLTFLTHWIFSRWFLIFTYLLIFHISSDGWFLVSYDGQKHTRLTSAFSNWLRLLGGLIYNKSWRMSHMCLWRMWFLLLLNRILGKWLSVLSGLTYCLCSMFSYGFSVWIIYSPLKVGYWSPVQLSVLLSISH